MSIPDSALPLLQLVLITYGSHVAPPLPYSFTRHFANPIVRAMVMILIAYMATRNPTSALVIGLGVFTTTTILEKRAGSQPSTQPAESGLSFSASADKTRGVPMDIYGQLQSIQPFDAKTGIQKVVVRNTNSKHGYVDETLTLHARPKPNAPIKGSAGQPVYARGVYFEESGSNPSYFDYMSGSGYLRIGNITYK